MVRQFNRTKSISVLWDISQRCYKINVELCNGNMWCGKYQANTQQELINFLAVKIHELETNG